MNTAEVFVIMVFPGVGLELLKYTVPRIRVNFHFE